MKDRVIRWLLKKLNYNAPDTIHAYLDRKEYEIVPVKKTITLSKEYLTAIDDKYKVGILRDMIDYIIESKLVKFNLAEIPTDQKENMQLTAKILVLKKINK